MMIILGTEDPQVPASHLGAYMAANHPKVSCQVLRGWDHGAILWEQGSAEVVAEFLAVPNVPEDSTSSSRSPGLPRLELGKELQKAKSTRKEERRALEKQALAEVGIEVGTPTDTPRSGAETPRTNASGGRSHR